MAFQSNSGIPFSISHKQQSFRLIELPPDLADTLSSPNPPILRFASSVQASQARSPSKPSYAMLHAGDKAYQIRQVSTSNSVFLLQPSAVSNSADVPAEMGVTAMATIGSTLELLPETTSVAPTSRKWHDRFKKAAA